jgi:hypothetical protein
MMAMAIMVIIFGAGGRGGCVANMKTAAPVIIIIKYRKRNDVST